MKYIVSISGSDNRNEIVGAKNLGEAKKLATRLFGGGFRQDELAVYGLDGSARRRLASRKWEAMEPIGSDEMRGWIADVEGARK